MRAVEAWRRRAGELKAETYALYLAYRDSRVPWYARVLAVAVVAYAFSPIDLIPDFIPVVGYVDDLFLVPLGMALVLRLIPPEVMAEARAKARQEMARGKPAGWATAAAVVATWLLLASLAAALIWRVARG